jgi:hypothetical protein
MEKNTEVTNHEEVISKSLDDVEEMIKSLGTGEIVSKALPADEPNPDEVSEDAPAPDEQDQAPTEDNAPEEQGDDADVDTDAEAEQNEQEDDEVEKSLESVVKSHEGARQALEVSEFLDHLVKSISEVIGTQNETLNKSMGATEQSQALLAKSFEGIIKSQKAVMTVTGNLQKSIQALQDRVDAVESQPLVRKSVSNAKALEKSFPASNGTQSSATGGNGTGTNLSKSVAIQHLSEEVMKGNSSFMNDVLALEGTGDFNALSSEARTFLATKQ